MQIKIGYIYLTIILIMAIMIGFAMNTISNQEEQIKAYRSALTACEAQ